MRLGDRLGRCCLVLLWAQSLQADLRRVNKKKNDYYHGENSSANLKIKPLKVLNSRREREREGGEGERGGRERGEREREREGGRKRGEERVRGERERGGKRERGREGGKEREREREGERE